MKKLIRAGKGPYSIGRGYAYGAYSDFLHRVRTKSYISMLEVLPAYT